MNHQKIQFGNKFKAILILVALVVITMGASVLQPKNVIFVLDGEEKIVETTANTVGDFLIEQDIEIERSTYLEPSVETNIVNDIKVEVIRPQDVIILDNGKETVVRTAKTLVKDILEEHGFELEAYDFTAPGVEQNIIEGHKNAPLIVINRVTKQTTTDIKSINYEVVKKENSELEKGKSNIITKGKNGTKLVTSETTIINDDQTSTKVLGEEVIEAPITEVQEVGTKVVKAAVSTSANVPSLGNKNVVRTLTMESTAYTSDPAENGGWTTTALGTSLRRGVVAVDPKVIPLGTKLYVEGYGYARAEDTGGAIKGNKIDVLMDSKSESRSWGRRSVTVHILGN